MKKVSIIGHFGFGGEYLDGQTIKTKTLTTELKKLYGEDEVACFDTHGGIIFLLKMPWVVLRTVMTARNIIMLPAYKGVLFITPLLVLYNILFRRHLHYAVVGGWLPDYVRRYNFLKLSLKHFDDIFVETRSMKQALEDNGLKNIILMPNCKQLEIIAPNAHNRSDEQPLKLCTFSRVMKEKGIEDAIEAVSRCNEQLGYTAFTLDVYGQVWKAQQSWFDALFASQPNYINYRGCIDYNDSVNVLKQYFALLFPTFYKGEGVAGTFIDAFAAGLPVITTNWHDNADIVTHGVTGFIVPVHDVDAMVKAILRLKDDSTLSHNMRNNCLAEATKYLPENVIKILSSRLNNVYKGSERIVKKTALTILVILSSISLTAKNPRPLLCNIDQLRSMLNTTDKGLANERKTIINRAERHISKPVQHITDKAKTISGNKHNYESMAIYYWPDPANPSGPYIVRDGERNPESDNYDGPLLNTYRNELLSIAKAYYLTSDKRFSDYANTMLCSWFINGSTMMAPNFDYGQFAPNIRNNTGNPGSISEAYYLTDIIEAYSLLCDKDALPQSTRKGFVKWLKQFRKWLTDSDLGKRMRARDNNLGTMYDILLYRISMVTAQKKYRKQIRKTFIPLRVESCITPTGEQPQELVRARAMNYSIYNLGHIVDFCILANADGYNIYRNCSDRIDAAVAFLMQYKGNKDSFPYQEISPSWEDLEKKLDAEAKRIMQLK